jgi:predicted site-specific integrase-resolvase
MSAHLVTARELAEMLSGSKPIASTTIMAWFHAGVIPAAIAENQVYRFDPIAVRAALAERAARKQRQTAPA